MRKAILTSAIAAGIVFIALIYAHYGPVNGPPYFRWPWYRETNQPKVLALLLLAAAPGFVAQFLRHRRMAIALLAVTPLLLQFTAIELTPPGELRGFTRAAAIIEHQYDTSYFTAAVMASSQRDWLRHYAEFTSTVPMHAMTKPPGPTSFFLLLIKWFGVGRTPRIAAIIMLTFGAMAVVATYFAFRTIAGAEVALQAATIVCFVPSMIGFYPVIDWFSPALAVAALALWYAALERDSTPIAAIFGLTVFAMSYWNYSLLVLGAPCAAMAIANRRFIKLSIVAACAIAIPYLALWTLFGLNPLHNFIVARENQRALMRMMEAIWAPSHTQRHYPATIIGDLQEFVMALGWVPVVVAVGWLIADMRSTQSRLRVTAIAALATPFVVALSGLLPAETARVWIFLMPLVALPAALELVHWSHWQRIALHVVLFACAAAVYCNIFFIIV